MELGKSISSLTVLVHIMVWLLLGFIVLFYPPLTWDMTVPTAFWIKQILNFFMLAGMFYFNALYMVPAFLVNEKKTVFIVWFVGAIVCFLVLARIIEINLHVNEQMAALKGSKSIKSKYTLDVHLFMVAILVMVISTSFAAAQRWQSEVKKHEMIEKQHIASELALLKAQINPHFFFNTLNNIYALTYSDIPLSREAILKLSRMMRYLLYETLLEKALLSQEISFMNDYIELMKLRLHAYTTLEVQEFKSDHEYSVAPMLLLPFIENAFKHGTSSLNKTAILIALNAQNGILTLKVKNQIHPNKDAFGDTNGGIGLVNTKRRLDLLYPGRHSLIIDEDFENKTYQVELKVEL
ncbi:sensor histidine kinase [Runella aurantiaca]|uniref:Histidine kinase n=1 Tax=Runella aurantiaca TaxID=2282308 RepID=A0A369ICW4_9BACT|nr:sensor histidine kinase [Runella aurantiaca]RDB05343.1 histidine kinase [Runella aurantiaca]